jgi:hypothetical protein
VVPLAPAVHICSDTTDSSVLLLVVIGFAATVGSIFLLGLRHVLATLAGIESNTRRGA